MNKWWVQGRQSPIVRGMSSLSLMKYSTKALALLRWGLLARWLGPAEIGAYSLALLVLAISEVFTETGINMVLLKHPQKFSVYHATAWGISIARGLLIAIGILTLRPYIVDFYDSPSLSTLLLMSSLIPLVRGAINPAIITWQQKLEFGKESAFRFMLQIIDLTTGLFFAWWLNSAVGLLMGLLISAMCEVWCSFAWFKQWPNWREWRWHLIPSLYKESKYIIGNGIMHYLTENVDDLLIGKVLGTTGLGLYHTAYKLTSAVTLDLASIMGQTLYPVYARLVEQRRDIRPALKHSSLFLICIYATGLGLFWFLTEPLVLILFGSEFREIVRPVQLLYTAYALKGFITIWNPLSILAQNLHHHVMINLIVMCVMIGGILTWAPRWGVTGASAAVLLAMVIVLPYAWIVMQQAQRKLRHV